MKPYPRVLLVEDDAGIATALNRALAQVYHLDIASTGKTALYKTDSENYKLVILDLNLPDLPGEIVCQQLRDRGYDLPILILSGESKVLTKIKLLDMGADDYLTKPFSLGELKARLRKLERQSLKTIAPLPVLIVGDLTLDRRNFIVRRDGIPIDLRRKEFALLECLMENAGSVVSRHSMTRHAWHDNNELWTNTVDVHIKRLRDKIDRPNSQSLIKTIHGRGYKLDLVPHITERIDYVSASNSN